MPDSTILFRAPPLTVHRQQERPDDLPANLTAVVVAGSRRIELNAEATELLVDYLRVIRAYFSSFQHSKKLIPVFLEQVMKELSQSQQQLGEEVLGNQHISDLIQQLGCVSDWQQWYYLPEKQLV
jgi:hypothetical protein